MRFVAVVAGQDGRHQGFGIAAGRAYVRGNYQYPKQHADARLIRPDNASRHGRVARLGYDRSRGAR